MRILALAIASSTLIAAPALAKSPFSSPPGKDPKVCLVTFAEAGSQADTNVVKAQYLPLQIALKLEMRNDELSDVFVYSEDQVGIEGVDYAYPNAEGTEATCAMLADMAADNDDDSDDSET